MFAEVLMAIMVRDLVGSPPSDGEGKRGESYIDCCGAGSQADPVHLHTSNTHPVDGFSQTIPSVRVNMII